MQCFWFPEDILITVILIENNRDCVKSDWSDRVKDGIDLLVYYTNSIYFHISIKFARLLDTALKRNGNCHQYISSIKIMILMWYLLSTLWFCKREKRVRGPARGRAPVRNGEAPSWGHQDTVCAHPGKLRIQSKCWWSSLPGNRFMYMLEWELPTLQEKGFMTTYWWQFRVRIVNLPRISFHVYYLMVM